MTGANAITGVQDTYVKKVLDTLNDLPNVIYEVAEEQPRIGDVVVPARHLSGAEL